MLYHMYQGVYYCSIVEFFLYSGVPLNTVATVYMQQIILLLMMFVSSLVPMSS